MTHFARYALSALLLCLLVTVPLRGGTAAEIRRIMDVLDFGTPLLNMHAPWELAAKVDCFWTQRAYRAYFAD